MTRGGAKATLVALALAATVGGWAVLAGREREVALAGSAAEPQPAAVAGSMPGQPPPAPSGDLLTAAPPAAIASGTSGVASPPRAVARTRSSR
jgi:hypothetical protein